MNIQLFADYYDELEQNIKNSKNNAINQMSGLEQEKQTQINDYNTNYNNQINNYNDLLKTEKENINTQTEQQKQIQQQNYNYNVDLINQQKQEAAKETDKQVKDAYVDYMKQTNEMGGALENLASRGLATQGYSESSKVSMYNTYQNRVGTAKEALLKANTDFNNKMTEAKLNNDAALAELELNKMNQMYQIALKGFEFTTNMYNQKLNYEQGLNEYYTGRQDTLQSRIDNYNATLGNIAEKREEQYRYEQEQARIKEQQKYERELAQKEFQEKIRQFNAQLAEDRRQFNATINSKKSSKEFSDTTKNTEDDRIVTRIASPKSLSTARAMIWVNDNIYKKGFGGVKLSALEDKLKEGYEKKILKEKDIKTILETYGIR